MTAKNILGNYSDPTGVYTFDGLGLVPIGGIIAIGDAGAWTLPANGQIKDGWALCNGQAKSGLTGAAAGIAANLPDLTDDRFLNGSTVTGGTGGAASKTTTGIAVTTLFKKDILNTGQINHTHDNTHKHRWSYTQDDGAGGSNLRSWDTSGVDTLIGGEGGATSTTGTNRFNIINNNSWYTENSNISGGSAATWTAYNSGTSSTFENISGTVTQGTIADIRPKYLNVVYVMRVK